jgi:putative colanic acid biosynthesis UDP-glucose lipid carrier transferase
MLLWFIATPVILSAWRASARSALRWARIRGLNTRKLAIAGGGELALHVARAIQERPWMGFQVVGLFDGDRLDERPATVASFARDSLDSLTGLALAGQVDVVYIALPPGETEREASDLIRKLSDSTTSVYLVQDRRSRELQEQQGSHQILPDLRRVDVLHRQYVNLGGIKVVSVYESPFNGSDGWVKRLEDILVGSVALVLLALPMVAIAIGVRLSGPGPVLFKQRRYGLDGREIMVWKFRSMSVCEDRGTVTQARKGDSRITPFGGFLRRTSLDELPQFFNVLQGSMSVVGPRPHAVSHNEHYRGLIGGYMLRHKVKPGITGWAQVNGWRGETESVDKMGRRVDFDLDYIRNWSLWLDVQIILKTFFKGFVNKNAY